MACAGIDFGNASSTIALARRGGIDIVANEVSNRATPSVVSFSGEERHIGEAAANFAMQNYRNTCTDLKRMLAQRVASPVALKEAQRIHYRIVAGENDFVAAECTYGKERERRNFTFEGLVGAYLGKLYEIALADTPNVGDIVMSVPGYFTDVQRRALFDAATIGNVKLLRLLNEHAAIALAYGIFRTGQLPEKDPITVAFVDIGEAKTTVCIAEFLKTGLKVVFTAHDPALGGRTFDDLLVDHFVREIKERYNQDVLSNPRSSLRLRKECEKVKKILSSNPEAILNIECLINDVDVSSSIKRADFQEMMLPLLERITAVCAAAISGAKISDLSKIVGVEVVGGGTRMPAVKSAIEGVFGQPVKTTLNADEAVARGCALMSAMLSPTFRVKEYAVVDATSHALLVSRTLDSDMVEGDDIPVVSRCGTLPSIKAISFKNAGPFRLLLKYDRESAIADYHIQAPAVSAEPGKVRVKVKVDVNGLSEVISASYVTEEEVEVAANEDAPSTNGVSGEKPASPSAAVDKKDIDMDTNEPTPPEAPADPSKADAPTDATKPAADAATKAATESPAASGVIAPEAPEDASPMETDARPKVKKMKKSKAVDLVVTRGSIGQGLSKDGLQRAVEDEAQMRSTDLYLRERNDARNALESYVYDLRSRMDDYGDLKDFVDQHTREKLQADLASAEDWIYSEEADEVSKSTFQQRRLELVNKAAPILRRKKEFDERDTYAEQLRSTCEHFKAAVIPEQPSNAHLTGEEKEKVLKSVEDVMLWLQRTAQEQTKLSKIDDPVLTTDELKAKRKELTDICKPIVEKPVPKPEKPKPAPAEAKPNDAAETNGASDVQAGEAAAAAPEAEPGDGAADVTMADDTKSAPRPDGSSDEPMNEAANVAKDAADVEQGAST